MKKIAIIGAGIAGITTAYSLAKRGHQVTVIDQRRYPAMATSYANGGQLSASNGETWNTSKNIVSGIKWMFKKDAPRVCNTVNANGGKRFPFTQGPIQLQGKCIYVKLYSDFLVDNNSYELHKERNFKGVIANYQMVN